MQIVPPSTRTVCSTIMGVTYTAASGGLLFCTGELMFPTGNVSWLLPGRMLIITKDNPTVIMTNKTTSMITNTLV